ncbi:FadR/GntR family transcriptional regulator [Azospirillum sp. TSO35-2]|uniref:FadR/GntR family transcriptional regulator n=1 Tax=Azospirillum sp. TSO35-2 TaxID=716796 RepID=UPI000D60910C|nr:FadR/GntR family transcriptional regulator [Azospirillum sp. TSO35-2]PWC31064.1 GntR family transcriptional regulator [Azospirillum sp. TSO35-2]
MDVLNVRDRAAHGAKAVVEFIERNIADGHWGPGTKLPTERDLEKRFGVSRNTLRKSLRQLEERGTITRHVGRGSFVARGPDQTENAASPPAAGDGGQGLVHRIHGASPMDVMDVRLMVEPQAAELAASRANTADLQRLEECLRGADQSHEVPDFERWDGMLHVAIVAAAKNGLLTDIYDAINDVRNQAEWARLKARSVTPQRRAVYQEQHHRVVAALKDRDGAKARAELHQHLTLVRANLLAASSVGTAAEPDAEA